MTATPTFGEPPGYLLLAGRRQPGKFGHMAHGDAPAQLHALGQVCHEVRIEASGIVAGIDMHIDVDIEAPRQLEDTLDLPGMIDVVVGRSTDHACAHFQALDQSGIGSGRICEALLREDANLEVNCPRVLLGELQQGLDTFHADGRVDFGVRTDARRAMFDAAFERLLCPRVDVLHRECGFHGLHAAHMVRLAAARLRGATVDDPRLVEMDVGLDQACAAKTSLGIVRGRIGLDPRLDRLDRPPAKPMSTRRPSAAVGKRALRMTKSSIGPSRDGSQPSVHRLSNLG